MTNNNTKKNNVYNSAVISALSDKYNVDKSFIYRALKSERSSITAESVKKDYKRIISLINPIVKNHHLEVQQIIEDYINAKNAHS